MLVFFGWLNIYATIHDESHFKILDFSTLYGKQIIWIVLAIPLIFFIMLLDAKFYERFASFFYMFAILLLVFIFPFGKSINGATSWYSFGSFTIQPAEFAKAFVALGVARLLSDKQFSLKIRKSQIKAFFLILLPAFLIILQPDPGSALIYGAFLFVFYRENLPDYYIIIGFIVILLFISRIFFGFQNVTLFIVSITIFGLMYLALFRKKALKKGWFNIVILTMGLIVYTLSTQFIYNNILKQHHRDRFEVLLKIKKDASDIGYNTNQAIKTISSGGFFGKGYLQGDRTQGKFVPEQETDYIFSAVGEEWGFVGSSLVVIIFVIFLLRIIHKAESQKNPFSRIYGYSIASIFFLHFTINIGMVMGILPTIGIPLPFFSYGGSALWGFTLLLFIFIRLDAYKTNEW